VKPAFLDFLRALLQEETRFVVVGAHALAVHGVPRATGDIDIWIDRTPDNVARVWRAIAEFGAPMETLGVNRSDLEAPDVVLQIGVPPRRIDVLTGVDGVEFEVAWDGRTMHSMHSLDVPFIGRNELILNKRASGRFRDLGDLEALGEDPRSG